MDRTSALLLTVLVGALVALQPPANALLGDKVGDVGAAFASLLVSTVIVGVILLATGTAGELADGIGGYRPVHLIGGVAGAAIVLATLVAVRHLGAAGVVAALVTAQLVAAAIADRLGILGLEGTPLSAARLAGIALLLGGTLLVTYG